MTNCPLTLGNNHLPPSTAMFFCFTIDGVDYVFNSTQLAIDEASVRDCVTITIINDEVSEGGETLQAYLSLVYVVNNSTVRNDSNVVLTVDQANITIYDSVGKVILVYSKQVYYCERKMCVYYERERGGGTDIR